MKLLQTSALLLFIAGLGFCSVMGVMPLNTVVTEADDIVVATVTSSHVVNGSWSVELAVQRVLKGSVKSGSNMHASAAFNIPGLLPSTKELNDPFRGITAIWFLKKGDTYSNLLSWISGAVGFTNFYIPVPQGELPTEVIYSADADPRQKLLTEIEVAALNPQTAKNISRLWSQLLLNDFGKDLLEPFYARLATASDATTKSLALSGQLRLNSSAAIVSLTSTPLSDSQTFADAVCKYRNIDPEGVTALGTLTGSKYPISIRTCAVYALREIHSKETLPLLESLLDNDSARFRYDAVIGIAQFAIGFPMVAMEMKPTSMATFRPSSDVTKEMKQNYPAMDTFSKNEQQYISFWKTWLSTHTQPAVK